jgi:hypothetical protein
MMMMMITITALIAHFTCSVPTTLIAHFACSATIALTAHFTCNAPTALTAHFTCSAPTALTVHFIQLICWPTPLWLCYTKHTVQQSAFSLWHRLFPQ